MKETKSNYILSLSLPPPTQLTQDTHPQQLEENSNNNTDEKEELPQIQVEESWGEWTSRQWKMDNWCSCSYWVNICNIPLLCSRPLNISKPLEVHKMHVPHTDYWDLMTKEEQVRAAQDAVDGFMAQFANN